MKEVWIPSSLKAKLTHSCPNSDEGKGYAVPWGEECDQDCGATNPPVNKFGKWGRAELMTDERADELLATYPGWVVTWEDHQKGVGVPAFLEGRPMPAPASAKKTKRRGRR